MESLRMHIHVRSEEELVNISRKHYLGTRSRTFNAFSLAKMERNTGLVRHCTWAPHNYDFMTKIFLYNWYKLLYDSIQTTYEPVTQEIQMTELLEQFYRDVISLKFAFTLCAWDTKIKGCYEQWINLILSCTNELSLEGRRRDHWFLWWADAANLSTKHINASLTKNGAI